MSVLPLLASSLKRRDEVPNQELAAQIVKRHDKAAIKELVELLSKNKKDIQNDCIKVLYEVGERNPQLIAAYIKEFVNLLESKNNRLQWGAMSALNTIASVDPKGIYTVLPVIMNAADKGSVITKDNAVAILIKLCATKQYSESAFSLLIEQLLSAPVNQLPMYAENAMTVVNPKNKTIFLKTLSSRLSDIEKESKRKRVEKVIQKITKQI
jgi:hypothetical protein